MFATRVLLCRGERHARFFEGIAQLFTSFFGLANIIPSDVVAELVLVWEHQRMSRRRTIQRLRDDAGNRSAYDILSAVMITPQTEFLDEGTCLVQVYAGEDVSDFATLIHYMRHALTAYG